MPELETLFTEEDWEELRKQAWADLGLADVPGKWPCVVCNAPITIEGTDAVDVCSAHAVT